MEFLIAGSVCLLVWAILWSSLQVYKTTAIRAGYLFPSNIRKTVSRLVLWFFIWGHIFIVIGLIRAA